ncbi:MAG: hypothetical protein AAB281_02785, partial [Actinomycetota bacterium]
KMRKVLLNGPKNGFFYVIDRITGELISAKPFAKVTWASHIDMKTGRPVENPGQRYENGTTSMVWPSLVGAHGWLPMAFSPRTNLVYLPTVELANAWDDKGIDYKKWQQPKNNIGDVGANAEYYPDAGSPFGTSYLQAWDPVTQKQVWKVPRPAHSAVVLSPPAVVLSSRAASTAGSRPILKRTGRYSGHSMRARPCWRRRSAIRLPASNMSPSLPE